jgi:L-ascorbate peroxidase
MVVVKVTGGPIIPFHPGREDKLELLVEGLLFYATKGYDHQRIVFGHIGLELWLCLVSTPWGDDIGRDRFEGPWISNPIFFDTLFYQCHGRKVGTPNVYQKVYTQSI